MQTKTKYLNLSLLLAMPMILCTGLASQHTNNTDEHDLETDEAFATIEDQKMALY